MTLGQDPLGTLRDTIFTSILLFSMSDTLKHVDNICVSLEADLYL